MNDLLVESGTASEAIGAASMTKAKPITALYQRQFRGMGGEVRSLLKDGKLRLISVRHLALIPITKQRANLKQSFESASTLTERNPKAGADGLHIR